MNGKNLSADRLNQNCEFAIVTMIVTNVIGPLTPGRDEPKCLPQVRSGMLLGHLESETRGATRQLGLPRGADGLESSPLE
jgi:hypothetical protein